MLHLIEEFVISAEVLQVIGQNQVKDTVSNERLSIASLWFTKDMWEYKQVNMTMPRGVEWKHRFIV